MLRIHNGSCLHRAREATYNALGFGFVLMLTVAPVAVVAKGLQPLSPLITLAAIAAGTAYIIRSGRWNAVLAVAGIALFPLAWVVQAHAGTMLGMMVWATSVLSWFAGLYRAASTAGVRHG